MPGGIFVSYRREDTQHAAGRLADRLLQTYTRDQLFMDVDNIEPGLDFTKVLRDKVQACDVLLAVIGPGWLNARDATGARRLDQQRDFVRIEIEAALARDVRVVPVLVDGAIMPAEEDLPEKLRPLVNRHAVRLSHERFGADAELLAKSLERVVPPAPRGWLAGFMSPQTPARSAVSVPSPPPARPLAAADAPPLVQTMATAPGAIFTQGTPERLPQRAATLPAKWDGSSIAAYAFLGLFSLGTTVVTLDVLKGTLPESVSLFFCFSGAAIAILRGRALTGLESAAYSLAAVIALLAYNARTFSNSADGELLSLWALGLALSLVAAKGIAWARAERLTGIEVASCWLVTSFTLTAFVAVLFHNLNAPSGPFGKPGLMGLAVGMALSALAGLWLIRRWRRRAARG